MYVVCLKAASTLEGKKEKESWEGGQEGGGVGRQNGRAGKGQGVRGPGGREGGCCGWKQTEETSRSAGSKETPPGGQGRWEMVAARRLGQGGHEGVRNWWSVSGKF